MNPLRGKQQKFSSDTDIKKPEAVSLLGPRIKQDLMHSPKQLTSTTHRIPGGALALACGAITHPSVHTQTRLQATVTEEAVSAGFIAEQSGPPWLASAFSFHRVAAEKRGQDNEGDRGRVRNS